MEIRDIIRVKGIAVRSKVISVKPEDTIADAIQILADHDIGLVTVKNGSGLAGVLSERDIVRSLQKHPDIALHQKVENVMTTGVKTCSATDHPFDVMQMMTEGKFRHMPVVDDGEVQGLVSATDIFKYITQNATPQEQAMMWSKISWV